MARHRNPDPLAGLNPEQRQAVETIEGPLLVLAGAGSGKTRVITVRIAHMLRKGIPPRHVLAMTFTNKAAREMRERVALLVGKKRAQELTVGTFHSFCLGALREHPEAAGLPEKFSICDASDQLSAWKAALRELRVAEATIQPSVLSSIVSLEKSRLGSPEAYLERAADDRDELIGRAWKRYDEHLRRSRTVDFDDLLLFTLRLLRRDVGVRAIFRERFRYLSVDEYQDTNGPQYEILREIAGGHRNLCAVGDDDQSIYGWRGADVRKILGFEKDFPGAKVVRLERNYRSTPQILDAANRVIANNPSRHEKVLKATQPDGPGLVAHRVEDEAAEAEMVVGEIQSAVTKSDRRPGDFAVLFRAAVQARALEQELRARGVRYTLVGGMSYFDRKEVRDVLAYLKVIANGDDETSLLRVLNTPPRGVGKTTIDKVVEFATQEGITVPEAFDRATEIEGVNLGAIDVVARFRERLALMGKTDPKHDLVAFVQRVVEDFAYRAEVERLYPDPQTREARWAAVTEVFNLAENYVKDRKRPSLRHFLERLALDATNDTSPEDAAKRETVTLMTLHAAKGLEFPCVYLVGLEEGILPHLRAVHEDSVEEERRLMYVGITRARERLVLSSTLSRAKYGKRVGTHLSRFVYELKNEAPPEGWIAAGTKPTFNDETESEAREKAEQKAAKKKAKKKRKRKKKATRGLTPRPLH